MEDEHVASFSREDLIAILHESRQSMKRDFQSLHNELLNKLEEHDSKLQELERLTQSSISIASKICQEVDLQGSKSALGKRTTKQQQAALEIPGICFVVNKPRVTWALTLNICKGLCDDLDTAIKSQTNVLYNRVRQSTLSRFLFAIQGAEKKSLHASTLGKECSLMVRSVVLRLFWSARRMPSISREPGHVSSGNVRGEVPDWLALETLRAARFVLKDVCFGPTHADGSTIENRKASNIKYVEENVTRDQLLEILLAEKSYMGDSIKRSVHSLESYKSQSSQVKRQRTSESSNSLFENLEDVFHNAVCACRTFIANQLTIGRARSREIAFKSFGFVLEALDSSYGLSRSNFTIEIPEVSQRELELQRRKESMDIIIGDAEVWAQGMDSAKEEWVKEENDKKFRVLMASFPSLTCKISYKVKYNATTHSQNSSSVSAGVALPADGRARTTEWIVSEEIPLHKAALDFLYEGLRAPTASELLRSYKGSLKAIHALSIAFRALILRTIGKPTSVVEDHMLGEVYLNAREWERLRVGSDDANISDGNNGQGKRAFFFVTERTKVKEAIVGRIAVTKRDYEDYLAKQIAREKETSQVDLSRTEAPGLPVDEDLDDTDDELIPTYCEKR